MTSADLYSFFWYARKPETTSDLDNSHKPIHNEEELEIEECDNAV